MIFGHGLQALILASTVLGSSSFSTFASNGRPSPFRKTTGGGRPSKAPRYLTATVPSETTEGRPTASVTLETLKEFAPDFDAARRGAVDAVVASKSAPPEMVDGLVHFVNEYFVACSQNPASTPESTAKTFLRAVEYGSKFGIGPDRYRFGTSHKAIRGTECFAFGGDDEDIDFYEFGVSFFRPTMDLSKSVVLGEENLKNAFEQTKRGENVVFLANHQSEADPQVFSCLLEECGLKEDGAEVIYVAGHKVTTDPLAIPFSMGRNLICIHSKKHIFSDPETQPAKQKQNLSAMTDMLNELRKGGTALWVAPSGGRDRRDLSTREVPIAPFDQKTVDMFRLLGNKSKKPTHFYSLAMSSYELCPPPDFVEAGVGEKRNVRYVPVGIACSPELENIGGVESRHLFTEHAEEVCDKDYKKLHEEINNK